MWWSPSIKWTANSIVVGYSSLQSPFLEFLMVRRTAFRFRQESSSIHSNDLAFHFSNPIYFSQAYH
jgi:hypothetical protein